MPCSTDGTTLSAPGAPNFRHIWVILTVSLGFFFSPLWVFFLCDGERSLRQGHPQPADLDSKGEVVRASSSLRRVEVSRSMRKWRHPSKTMYLRLCPQMHGTIARSWGVGSLPQCLLGGWKPEKERTESLVHRMYSKHPVTACIPCQTGAWVRQFEEEPRKLSGPLCGPRSVCPLLFLPLASHPPFRSFPLLYHFQDSSPHPHSGQLTSLPFQMAPGIELSQV